MVEVRAKYAQLSVLYPRRYRGWVELLIKTLPPVTVVLPHPLPRVREAPGIGHSEHSSGG